MKTIFSGDTIEASIIAAGAAIIAAVVASLITNYYNRKTNKEVLSNALSQQRILMIGDLRQKNFENSRSIARDAYMVISDIAEHFSYDQVMFFLKEKEYDAENTNRLVLKHYQRVQNHVNAIKTIRYAVAILKITELDNEINSLYSNMGGYITKIEELSNPNRLDRNANEIDKIFGDLRNKSNAIHLTAQKIKNELINACNKYETDIHNNIKELSDINN